MGEASTLTATKMYAVVTGGNKGIGFEVCKHLASKGYKVVLTARDEKRGLEAVEKLKQFDGLSELVIFHQLDIANNQSIASLADFVKSQFGRLDILVNNAGISGTIMDSDAMTKAVKSAGGWPAEKMKEIIIENYDLAKQCLLTNCYGSKSMVEAFIPLVKLSPSPRIVNVSSNLGLLERIPNEWAKEVLNDIDNLTEERVDKVVNEFLKDFKEGQLETKKWPTQGSAYVVSKAALNAYSRVLAKKYPEIKINCVHPGYVKTDITCNTGELSAAEGAEYVVMAALLPDDGPSGKFFYLNEASCF